MRIVKTASYEKLALRQSDIKKQLEEQAKLVSPTVPVMLQPQQGNGGKGPRKPLPPAAARGVVGPQVARPMPAGTKPPVPMGQNPAMSKSPLPPGFMPGPPNPATQAALFSADSTPQDQKTPATNNLERAKRDLSVVNPNALQTPAEVQKAQQTAALLGNTAKRLDLAAKQKTTVAPQMPMKRV